jgi:hypothetical protein
MDLKTETEEKARIPPNQHILRVRIGNCIPGSYNDRVYRLAFAWQPCER